MGEELPAYWQVMNVKKQIPICSSNKELLYSLIKEGANFIIIGGAGVNYHAPSRKVGDIDFYYHLAQSHNVTIDEMKLKIASINTLISLLSLSKEKKHIEDITLIRKVNANN